MTDRSITAAARRGLTFWRRSIQARVVASTLLLSAAVVGVVAYSGLNAALLLLAALVIGLFGCHLIALGILGHYVWRGLDAARKRPLYSIEAVAKAHDVPAAVAGDRRQ